MATAKIVTWSRPDKDGQYPIGIKIWNNGKPSYIFEGHTLPSRDLWDAKKQEVKKSVPNSSRLTNLLTKRLSEVRDKALQLETEKPRVSAQAIKKSYKYVPEDNTPKAVTFLEMANTYLQEQTACGNYDVLSADKSRLKRFYEFTDDGNITFPEITADLLHRFVIVLRQSKNRNCKKNAPKLISERTITNHLLLIRTLYNRAITAGHASKDDYPFSADGKIKIKFGNSPKIGLDEAEIIALEELDLSGAPAILEHARNIWLTSFYFAGMRITDALMLKWSDFQKDRLFYTMSKNEEPGSLKVPQKAVAILDKYRFQQNRHGFVFSLLNTLENLDDKFDLRRKINTADNRISKSMKLLMVKIGSTKNASPHKARHAFAQRAEDKNVHPKVLQKMYRHESILTTMKYQSNFSFHKADEAIDAVLDF